MQGPSRGTSRVAGSAAFLPDRFYCLLDELPLHLLPSHVRKVLTAGADKTEALVWNPQCVVRPGASPPAEVEGELCAGLALQGRIAWVRNRHGNLLPFWLGNEFEKIADDLVSARCPPESLSPKVRNLLRAANILVPAASSAQPEMEARIPVTAAQFREKGYAPIGGLIHPFHIAGLRRYYRHLIRTGKIKLGDRQSPRRYAAYNEPVARFFHRQIAGFVSAIAGEPVIPSYVYFASYLSGAELAKHVDREQCEFSVTLCLDFSPEPELATPWPISLETCGGTTTVYQAIGDGLAYRGTRLPHYRSKLPEGQTSSSIFFHYVRADFPGSLN